MSLGHRERVIRALNHEEPDRVPVNLGSTNIEKYQELKAHFGLEAEDTIFERNSQVLVVHEPILQAQDIDFRCVMSGPSDSSPGIPVGEDGYRDEWGVLWRKPPGFLYYEVVNSPLAGSTSVHDIASYPWPDPCDPGYTGGLRDRILA